MFRDLNKAQMFKMPYKNSPHPEIQLVMRFNYLYLFNLNEHKEKYHIRKPNDGNLLFEIEDKKYIIVGGKVITFEADDTILNYSSELGFDDIKFPYAYGGENIYFMLHRKSIPIQAYKNSTEKDEYQYLYKKGDEKKGVVEHGKDFIYCKNISDKISK